MRLCSVCGLLTNGVMFHQPEDRDVPKPDERAKVFTSEQAALEYARGQHALEVAEEGAEERLLFASDVCRYQQYRINELEQRVKSLLRYMPNHPKDCAFYINGNCSCGFERAERTESKLRHQHCTADGKHSPECVAEQLQNDGLEVCAGCGKTLDRWFTDDEYCTDCNESDAESSANVNDWRYGG